MLICPEKSSVRFHFELADSCQNMCMSMNIAWRRAPTFISDLSFTQKKHARKVLFRLYLKNGIESLKSKSAVCNFLGHHFTVFDNYDTN